MDRSERRGPARTARLLGAATWATDVVTRRSRCSRCSAAPAIVRSRRSSGGEELELAPGVTISFGDAVALGDYFGSFEEIQKLARKEGKGPGTRGEVLYVLWRHVWGKPDDNPGWFDEGQRTLPRPSRTT